LGLLIFAIAFIIIIYVSPFSVKKEIEDDQNTSLGIIIGSVILGIAIIIAAAIHG
jgi:putative membrane protein